MYKWNNNELQSEISGEFLCDNFSLGRYATDASIYQMMPIGVVIPKSIEDVQTAISYAGNEKLSIIPRGGGTSQCGQTINHGIVIDNSKYLNRIIELDIDNQRCIVEPGIVLDELNRALQPHGLWFPVDVSTSSRATIGGMAGNNSCGGRSIRYGTMRDNVLSINAILSDGNRKLFGPVKNSIKEKDVTDFLVSSMIALGKREADEIQKRFPKVMRRVGGYNIDALVPSHKDVNLAHLLVGSEGTLAYSTAIELKLAPLLKNKVMGVCHFSSFYHAMDTTQHLVKLNPQAVELIDSTMISLANNIELFRPTVKRFVRDNPEALLLVEFAEEDQKDNLKKLNELEELMGDLGFSWNGTGKKWGGVIPATDNHLQTAIAEVRKSGLNIMMSMKEEGKPVSFVEDCAVELEHLAEYTAGLTEIFSKYDTKGTWYAHASVGCLHVRPILNMKLDKDVNTMRAIAEEAFELVRKYKGSHSGEHGDGIVRSEFHEKMFGSHIVSAFSEVKRLFDPRGVFNPGKIVSAPKMDNRSLFRYRPDYKVDSFDTVLDWSEWPGAGGGFQGAVEMCNNNGACRKLAGGIMCPSYRITRNEQDVTRGRANVLRLAISGQLGEDAFTSDDMMSAMKLCVSCKGCKRECPTGVDMARMKIEVLAARAKEKGTSFHDRLIGYLPHYAPYVSRFPWLLNLPNQLPLIARMAESFTGFTSKRPLPTWHNKPFHEQNSDTGDVILFADTFNLYFSPENLHAASNVLKAADIKIETAKPMQGTRPLCCGRTFLSVGLIDKARAEAKRLIQALLPHAKNGKPIIGLEPSCLLTLRDEIPALLPGPETDLIAKHAMMFEEFIADRIDKETLDLNLKSPGKKILLHGHCHQKAFGIMSDIEKTLQLLPETEIETIQTSCCGMAGAFGYNTETQDISLQMGELDLFPAIRKSDPDTLIVADGTSCQHQIFDGTGRRAMHVARVLEMALAEKVGVRAH